MNEIQVTQVAQSLDELVAQTTELISLRQTKVQEIKDYVDSKKLEIDTATSDALAKISGASGGVSTADITKAISESELKTDTKLQTLKENLDETNAALAEAELNIANLIKNGTTAKNAFDYLSEDAPATNTNPSKARATWYQTTKNICFICIDNTADSNVWQGSDGSSVSPNAAPSAPVVSDFRASVGANSTFTYQPSGATDSDGTVAKYEVLNISPAGLLSVAQSIVNAGDSFNFTVASTKVDASVSFEIRAIDDKGLAGASASVVLAIKPSFAGEMGELGAGVGVNHAAAAKCGLSPMLGCDEPSSENFGNYTDANNSIFVCIPRIYYKINNSVTVPELAPRREVLISYEEKPNYILAPAFEKSDGTSVECVFVSKYQLSNSLGCDALGGIAKSAKNADPVCSYTYSSTSAYNSFSRLTGRSGVSPSDMNKGAFSVVKTMGDKYCLHYALLHQVYYLVAEAHLQASIKKYGSLAAIPASICAWADKEPYFPKGNNSNSLSDYDDTSLTFSKAAYSNKALTGSCSNLAKTSHNGQACGIIDLNGNMWEINAGFIRTASGFYVASGIDKLVELTESNYEDTSRYKLVSFAGRDDDTNHYVGNGSNAIFSADESNKYADATLRTLNTARSAAGLNAYGKDYQYLLLNSYAPIFGGDWSGTSYAGLLTVTCSGWAGYSTLCGLRALLVP